MKYSNILKHKYSEYKPKEIKKSSTLEKDNKSTGTNYKLGVMGYTKYKTSKNSRIFLFIQPREKQLETCQVIGVKQY